MKHKGLLFSFPLALAAGLIAASCKEQNLFNKDTYRYNIHINYPVDTLDIDHPWTLLKRITIPVLADVSDNSISEVRLFNAHPLNDANAEMVAYSPIAPGGTARLTFDVAQTQDAMYAMLVGRSEKCYVVPFYSNQGIINFSGSDMKEYAKCPDPILQTFTYVYESSFPTPDDFDYNDLVMRVSSWAPEPNVLQVRVTLAAAGCGKKMAGAIRLPGIRYEDVEHVEIEEGYDFIEDYPQQKTLLNADNNNMLRSRSGEAVLCLFEDAHYALSGTVNELGVLTYKTLNTDPYPDGEKAETVPIKSRTYNIYMNIGVKTDSLLLGNLDPFIIERSGQIYFEVHTYKYKFSEVVWEYLGDDKRSYDDYLAWALAIPSATFRYSVEEVPLGTYRDGELYGAYGTKHHSFGEWARDYHKAYDWWKYPNSALVY